MAVKIDPAAFGPGGSLTPAERAEIGRRHPVPTMPLVQAVGEDVHVYPDRANRPKELWWWWGCRRWVYYPDGAGGRGHPGGPPPALLTAAHAVARAAGILPDGRAATGDTGKDTEEAVS